MAGTILNTLVKFELKKFFLRKKNILVLILFALILFLFIFTNNRIDHRIQNSEISNCKEDIETTKDMLDDLQSIYQTERVSALKKQIDRVSNMLLYKKAKYDSMLKNDWKNVLESDIQIDKLCLESIYEETTFTSDTPEIIKQRIEMNQKLIDGNIIPININYSMTSYNFLRLSMKEFVPFFLIIIIFLLSADAVSFEFDDNTYKLLLTNAYSRYKVISSKIIATYIACIGSIVIIYSIIFILLGLINGFGSPNYPISVTGINSSIIPIRSLIIKTIPFLLLLVLFYITLSILISTILTNSVASMGFAVIMCSAFSILNPLFSGASKWLHLIPFTYKKVHDVIDGTASLIYSNPKINTSSGFFVLSLYLIVNIMITQVIFQKKDLM